MLARTAILVFDSGLGGLTVYREIAAVRLDADFIYVADDAAFPYGGLAEAGAGRGALLRRSGDEIGLADEIRDETAAGGFIDGVCIAKLLDPPSVHDGDTV